jgi:hypothetical protein
MNDERGLFYYISTKNEYECPCHKQIGFVNYVN